ncbi:hypothetical protein [Frankia sp. Cppng1_Ct_nod]|uniref:hypothetical protein n=1 Tax=Frankia sp. Cppng1_Ct_nod TaxID=2897162 RepID=UPI0010410825|nr:hypothetical protein [Frankia sp. Cppng1_Ct_nod]
MFLQVFQGRVGDVEEVRSALDRWVADLAPTAPGWLGSTAGVTDGGMFVGLARFASAEEARRNSERPEQHQWWMETAKLFSGEVVFHDYTDVEQMMGGGSDDAGFVQVIQGRTTDAERLRALGREFERLAPGLRPDILGATAGLAGDGTFTQAVYFTSEEAARTGERAEPPPEVARLMEQENALMADLFYFDLRNPWLVSPR